MKRIAIFASGTGSNAEKIIAYFKDSAQIKIALIVSNKPDAGVLQIANRHEVPTLVIERDAFFKGDGYVTQLEALQIDSIILACFLWKIPTTLLKWCDRRIINIHPALLPKYGGKGMYGNAVHTAVVQAGETSSGITIHFVDEHYDRGVIIFQAECPVYPTDTAENIATRIQALEHKHFPRVIEQVITT